jgi:hypothetical protein
MYISDIINKINSRTPEERKALLIKAKILTEDGFYHPDYFSKETIEKDKLCREKVNAYL